MSKSELSTGREAGNVKHGDQDQITFVQMQEQDPENGQGATTGKLINLRS